MNPELGHEPVDVDLFVANDNPWTEKDFEALRHLRMKVGDSITVTEKTYTGEVFNWLGVVAEVHPWGYVTKHRRDVLAHPEWMGKHSHAYTEITTKHYNKP